MYSINIICDYIIAQCSELRIHLDLLKLQKLLYYCQSWSLAYRDAPLFEDKFQAWVHGPVARSIYNRFSERGMYSTIGIEDIREEQYNLNPDDSLLISSVLSSYGKFTGDQLEYLTHTERPWQEAREGLSPSARSENAISETTIKTFYKERLSNS